MTRHELEDYCRTANIIPVSAIISYSIYGEMIPLYIRIEENSYKILSYEQKGNMSLNMPCSWICEIQDENYKKSIELIYFKDINIWGVRKRLK